AAAYCSSCCSAACRSKTFWHATSARSGFWRTTVAIAAGARAETSTAGPAGPLAEGTFAQDKAQLSRPQATYRQTRRPCPLERGPRVILALPLLFFAARHARNGAT